MILFNVFVSLLISIKIIWTYNLDTLIATITPNLIMYMIWGGRK